MRKTKIEPDNSELEAKKLKLEIRNLGWLTKAITLLISSLVPLGAVYLTFILIKNSNYFDNSKILLDNSNVLLEIKKLRLQDTIKSYQININSLRVQNAKYYNDSIILTKRGDLLHARIANNKKKNGLLNKKNDSLNRSNEVLAKTNNNLKVKNQLLEEQYYNMDRGLKMDRGYLVRDTADLHFELRYYKIQFEDLADSVRKWNIKYRMHLNIDSIESMLSFP